MYEAIVLMPIRARFAGPPPNAVSRLSTAASGSGRLRRGAGRLDRELDSEPDDRRGAGGRVIARSGRPGHRPRRRGYGPAAEAGT
jgi:hypothetical protein